MIRPFLAGSPLATLLLILAGAQPAAAQQVYVPAPAPCPPPVVSYYPPAVSYYPAPTVTYYAAPAPVYVAPPAVTTYYRYGLFGRRVVATTYYP